MMPSPMWIAGWHIGSAPLAYLINPVGEHTHGGDESCRQFDHPLGFGFGSEPGFVVGLLALCLNSLRLHHQLGVEPSLAYVGIPVLGERAGALALMMAWSRSAMAR